MDATTIVRVIAIVDTREYQEVGDRWVPVPGSGHEHECSRCGRLHEVHATVELSDGATAIVGTGCASQESAEIRCKMRSAASAAKRLATLRARREKLARLATEYTRVCAEVGALPLPAIMTSRAAISTGGSVPVWSMGDADVWGPGLDALTDERRACLTENWRRNRCLERGVTYAHEIAARDLSYTDESIDKLLDRRSGKS